MKGQVMELIIVSVLMCVFFVALLFASNLYNSFSEKTDIFSGTAQEQRIGDSVERSFISLDYGMLMLAIGLVISTVVSGFFIQTHPIFFIVSLICLIIVVSITPILSNSFMGIATTDEFTESAEDLPVSINIIGNLPIFVTVAGILLSIALYAKYGGGD